MQVKATFRYETCRLSADAKSIWSQSKFRPELCGTCLRGCQRASRIEGVGYVCSVAQGDGEGACEGITHPGNIRDLDDLSPHSVYPTVSPAYYPAGAARHDGIGSKRRPDDFREPGRQISRLALFHHENIDKRQGLDRFSIDSHVGAGCDDDGIAALEHDTDECVPIGSLALTTPDRSMLAS